MPRPFNRLFPSRRPVSQGISLENLRNRARAFQDAADWARRCKFTDCEHTKEPGCQIQAAVERGELDLQRLENFKKLERELEFQTRKTDARTASEARKKWKKIGAEGKQRGDWKRRF